MVPCDFPVVGEDEHRSPERVLLADPSAVTIVTLKGYLAELDDVVLPRELGIALVNLALLPPLATVRRRLDGSQVEHWTGKFVQ